MYMVSRITCQYIFYSKNIIFTLDATIHLAYIGCKETEKGNEQMTIEHTIITAAIVGICIAVMSMFGAGVEQLVDGTFFVDSAEISAKFVKVGDVK